MSYQIPAMKASSEMPPFEGDQDDPDYEAQYERYVAEWLSSDIAPDDVPGPRPAPPEPGYPGTV